MKTVNYSPHQRHDCELASHLADRKVQAASFLVYQFAVLFLSVFHLLLVAGDRHDGGRLIEIDKLLQLRVGKAWKCRLNVGGRLSRTF